MELKHYPESDMLYLGLAEAESVEGEEVTEGVVFHYDAENRIVSIEIDEASRRVNLKDISHFAHWRSLIALVNIGQDGKP